jgi:glycosyltransferase involved in cell wall biosynthesis
VVFWSEAGRSTLRTYGGIEAGPVVEKSVVVYPAVRRVDDSLIRYSTGPASLLFSGDFFRKGGVNVVDAFVRIRQQYPETTLTVCCDEQIDFRTPNVEMRREYLTKLHGTPGIRMLGRVPREELINRILPDTDVLLVPTYAETFGFAVPEAMAFGIPVIATNHFAIPEMIEHGVNGFLVDTSAFDSDRLFRGYVVDTIPADFRELVTEGVYGFLKPLVESPDLRRRIGTAAVETARLKFSVEKRNERMLEIYRAATG